MRRADVSNAKIEVRLTPEEKNQIINYCAEHNITISDLVRKKIFNIQEEE